MDNKKVNWELIFDKYIEDPSSEKIVDILLKNRGIKNLNQKKEFLNPIHPKKIKLDQLKINSNQLEKSIKRLKLSLKNKEKVIIYGDYDADGITATGILWEILYELGFDVLPHIPERFSEGYGINFESVKSLKEKYPNLKLIITVDNGIVASKEIKKINKLGIDVIITDHHEKKEEKLGAFSIIHTTLISGSGIAWIFAREINKAFSKNIDLENKLDLVSIGTIADQVSLIGANRSFVKWGLIVLNETKRLGLISLFKEAGLKKGEIGTYQVGFIIAPRINAMGRIEHAIDSLRLLCTKNLKRSEELANTLGNINKKRQKIVDEVVEHAKKLLSKNTSQKVIILSDKSYHEGVIGLAASKLVEEFYKPAIVMSKGKEISKASARSIYGFNIIETIRKLDRFLINGGGHPMAAGFSILTNNVKEFERRFQKLSSNILTEDILLKKIKVDMILDYKSINMDLINKISNLEPFGIGNYYPVFMSKNVLIKETKIIGKDKKHMKFLLESQNKIIEAIAFNKAEKLLKLKNNDTLDIIYSLDKNIWDGREKIQIIIKELKTN